AVGLIVFQDHDVDRRRLARAGELVVFEVRIDHAAGVPVEDTFLEQRIGEPHQDAAMHLALDLPWIYWPAAILHGDDALHAHDTGLGIYRHFGKLHATQIPVCQGGVAHALAKPRIIVAARSNRADAIGAQTGGGFPETDAAAGVVANQDSSVTRDQVLGGGIERKSSFAQQQLQDAPGSGARRRRDRGGGTATVRRWPRRKLGIADAYR